MIKRPGLLALALVPGVLLLAPVPADAARQYRWKDGYGDTAAAAPLLRPPESPAGRLAVPASHHASAAQVRLRIEVAGTGYRAYADNLMHGPVQVALRYQYRRNVDSRPALPATALVPARSSVLLATLAISHPARAGNFELLLDALPGHPASRPRDHDYPLPFEDAPVRVHQGPGGSFSHSDAPNLHAIDFALAEGTPIRAAREGVVMQIEADFEGAGVDLEAYGARANFVRVVHDDGSMAVYAHLQPDSLEVSAGQRVHAGQRMGLSGNTGFSTAPHLHFVVQVNRGMRLESVPLRMFGPMGELKFPGPEHDAEPGRAAPTDTAP